MEGCNWGKPLWIRFHIKIIFWSGFTSNFYFLIGNLNFLISKTSVDQVSHLFFIFLLEIWSFIYWKSLWIRFHIKFIFPYWNSSDLTRLCLKFLFSHKNWTVLARYHLKLIGSSSAINSIVRLRLLLPQCNQINQIGLIWMIIPISKKY